MSKLTTLALAGVVAFAASAAFAQSPNAKPDASGNASMSSPSAPAGAKVDKNGDSKPVDQNAAGKPAHSGTAMKPMDKTTGSGNADPETRLDSTNKQKENSSTAK